MKEQRYKKVVEVKEKSNLYVAISNFIALIILIIFTFHNQGYIVGLFSGINLFCFIRNLIVYFDKSNRKVYFRRIK